MSQNAICVIPSRLASPRGHNVRDLACKIAILSRVILVFVKAQHLMQFLTIIEMMSKTFSFFFFNGQPARMSCHVCMHFLSFNSDFYQVYVISCSGGLFVSHVVVFLFSCPNMSELAPFRLCVAMPSACFLPDTQCSAKRFSTRAM